MLNLSVDKFKVGIILGLIYYIFIMVMLEVVENESNVRFVFLGMVGFLL